MVRDSVRAKIRIGATCDEITMKDAAYVEIIKVSYTWIRYAERVVSLVERVHVILGHKVITFTFELFKFRRRRRVQCSAVTKKTNKSEKNKENEMSENDFINSSHDLV